LVYYKDLCYFFSQLRSARLRRKPVQLVTSAPLAMLPGRTPRRLLQTHGAFVNCTLTPRLRQRRTYGGDAVPQFDDTVGTDAQKRSTKRWNSCLKYNSNDEVFDVREGEILLTSRDESGFPNHRRGVVFSSLNAWGGSGGGGDPDAAIAESDLKFVGLAQTPYVSSNTSLQSQGLVAQCSGVKTIINTSEETISVGDRLMAGVMRQYPTKQRKGVPNEKVTMTLRKVPAGGIANIVQKRVKDVFKSQNNDALVEAVVRKTILEFRKAGNWVVGKAVSSARQGEQLDVLLTKPSFL
jgi:hypothetical protein